MSDERYFVDTNILIYAHDRSASAKHEQARALIESLWENGNGCLSIQVLQEFYVNATRKINKPLNTETAKDIIASLGEWPTHSPTVGDVLAAIELQRRYSLSFWDAMILTSAAKLECNVLLSEDLSEGHDYDGVKVVNPFSGEMQKV